MRNLLWKEWHEQSWKLAFGCIVLSALVLIGLRARIIADDTMVMSVCFISIILLPLLAGTGLIPSERAEGSFESLIAMPIAPWRILSAKTLMGVLLCVGPMLVVASISLWIAGDREMSRMDMVGLYMRSTMTILSLFFWMLAATARLPSEARAGLVAVGVFICWMILTLGLNSASMPRMFFVASPFAYVNYIENQGRDRSGIWLIAMIQLAIASMLWICTVGALRESSRVGE